MNKNNSFYKLNFIKKVLMSGVLLLPLVVYSIWLIADFRPPILANNYFQKEVDPSAFTQLLNSRIVSAQTNTTPCLISDLLKGESEILPNQKFFSGNRITEKGLFVGRGEMQDLFYRYPCPPAIPGDLSIHPKNK